MPKYTQLAVVKFPCRICFNRFVYTEILMVTGKDFYRAAVGMIIKYKVFQQVEKILFFTDSAQHCFKSYAALFFLIQSFPFMEKLIFTSQCTDFCLQTVGEHKESIIIKQMRNGILIIGIIIIVGVLYVYGAFL